MNTPIPNQIIREITPLSDKDCFYIAERYKTEFTYPIHNHSEFELNFTAAVNTGSEAENTARPPGAGRTERGKGW